MPSAGMVLEGPNGFRLRLVRTGAESGGDLLEMEASYAGRGDLPPTHLHPKQDEQFEVLEGAVRAIIYGDERVYETGKRFEVPAGTPHQMAGDGPARVRWEVRPPLRTAEFFERLYGALAGRPAPGDEGVDLFAEYSDEIRLVTE